MDSPDHLALVNQRRDAVRVGVGIVSLLFFIFGLVMLGLASRKTETKSSGHLWWAEEKTVPIPPETRLALLFAGVVLLLVAFTLALILYRISIGRAVNGGGGHASAVTVNASTGSSYVASGHSKEFWISTTIAILGLLITATGAAAAWWA